MSAFLSILNVEEVDELDGTWRLTAPLVYQTDLLSRVVVAPFGFVTDFASVPRILGVYDLVGGRCNRAAVIHDWLYTSREVERLTADQIFAEAILASGYSRLTAFIFYTAVRFGGASHWEAPNQPQPAGVQELIDVDNLEAK